MNLLIYNRVWFLPIYRTCPFVRCEFIIAGNKCAFDCLRIVRILSRDDTSRVEYLPLALRARRYNAYGDRDRSRSDSTCSRTRSRSFPDRGADFAIILVRSSLRPNLWYSLTYLFLLYTPALTDTTNMHRTRWNKYKNSFAIVGHNFQWNWLSHQ